MEPAITKELLLTEIERDRKAIGEQIFRIEAELRAMSGGEKVDLPLEARYWKLSLEYFLKKNQVALEEIDKYLEMQFENACASYVMKYANPRNVRYGLLPHASDPLECLTYSYRFRNPITFNYDPHYLKEIDYRFHLLPAPNYRQAIGQIRDWYEQRHVSDEFNQISEAYIQRNIAPELKNASLYNHFISNKRECVVHILERFQSQDYISLAHILPSIIEGVFHDICESIGLKAAILEKASLTDALKTIQATANPIGIEYMLFIFPIRRNRIAHGRNLDEGYRSVALSFLLDLDLLIRIAGDRNIPLNMILTIFRNPTVKTFKDIFNLPILELQGRLADDCQGLSIWLQSDGFWTELEKEITSRDIAEGKTERFVKKLLWHAHLFSAPPATEQISDQCKRFLRTVLPRTKKRIAAQNAESAKAIELIKQLLSSSVS